VELPHRHAAAAAVALHGASRRPRALNVKRASERPSPADGIRILVDRRWPPGLPKERVAADLWLKDAAPSDALARACGRDPSRWDEFRAKYRAELASHADLLRLLDELRHRGPVTLLHSHGNGSRNHAVALREILQDRHAAYRQPPDDGM
jgi:uncharacterized protein YeaO (DUF488 family)